MTNKTRYSVSLQSDGKFYPVSGAGVIGTMTSTEARQEAARLNSEPIRTHNPAWADNTRSTRQAKRRAALNQAAQGAGYASWSAYETAVINGKAQVQQRQDER